MREHWEGRVAAGRFPLLEFLGGSLDRGVFLTVLEGAQKAAIKLIPAEGPDADLRLALWERNRELSHPNLMKIFESGRCVIDEANLIYVVTERAETDLAHVIPNKALDADEAANIFLPVIEALLYLHRSQIIHGHVKPSNILLVSGRAKLSTDDFLVAGGVARPVRQPVNYDAPEVLNGRPSAAADTWSLGMTLAEAMTRQLLTWDWSGKGEPSVPASLPEPYLEIVRECLRLNPSQRCTLRSILARLEALKQVSVASAPRANGNQLAPTIDSTASPEVPISSTGQPARFESTPKRPDPVPIKEVSAPPSPQPSPAATAIPQPAPAPDSLPAAAARFASVGAERPISKWDFEPDPMPRVFTHLGESEARPFPIFRVIVGVLILLAVGAVLFVGVPKDDVEALLEHLNLRSPSQSVGQPSAPVQPPLDASQSRSHSQSQPPPAGDSPTAAQASAPVASPSSPTTAPGSAPTGSRPPTPSAPTASPGSQSTAAAHSGTQAGPQFAQSAAPSPTLSQSSPKTEPAQQAPTPAPAANAQGVVASRVMPNVSTAAHESMERPTTVALRVFVNRQGGVSGVAYLSSGPGNYFARSAYRAAQSWKFSPPRRHGEPQPSVWTLHFYFSRGATDVEATQEGR